MNFTTRTVLNLPQPLATELVTKFTTDPDGTYGVSQVVFTDEHVKHRGIVLVCAAGTPAPQGFDTSCVVGEADIYRVCEVDKMSASDWLRAAADKDTIKRKYAVFLRNPRRMVEVPFNGQIGLYKGWVTDDLEYYPIALEVDTATVSRVVKSFKKRKKLRK